MLTLDTFSRFLLLRCFPWRGGGHLAQQSTVVFPFLLPLPPSLHLFSPPPPSHPRSASQTDDDLFPVFLFPLLLSRRPPAHENAPLPIPGQKRRKKRKERKEKNGGVVAWALNSPIEGEEEEEEQEGRERKRQLSIQHMNPRRNEQTRDGQDFFFFLHILMIFFVRGEFCALRSVGLWVVRPSVRPSVGVARLSDTRTLSLLRTAHPPTHILVPHLPIPTSCSTLAVKVKTRTGEEWRRRRRRRRDILARNEFR